MNPLLAFGLLLGIVVVGGGAYMLFFANNTSQMSSQLPQFANNNQTVPSSYSKILSENNAQESAQLASLTQSQLSTMQQFSVSYTGVLYATTTASGTPLTINSSFSTNLSKFGNSIKLSFDAPNLPILGNGEVIYLNGSNGTHTCANFNIPAISSGNYQKLILGSRSISCINSGSLAGVNLGKVADFNLTLFSDQGLLLNYTSYYQSTFNGQQCTFMSGAVQQGSTSVGNFEICMSDTYYVPLSMAMYFSTQKGSVSLVMNETSISNTSNQSYVTSIPGHVVS